MVNESIEGPPERGRRGEIVLRRIQRNVVVMLAVALGALWFLGEQSMEAAAASSGLFPQTPGTWAFALAAVFAAVFLNGLFVAGETAVDLLRPIHAKHAKEDARKTRRLQRLLENKSRYVAACTLGSQTMRMLMVLVGFLMAPGLALVFQETFGAVAAPPETPFSLRAFVLAAVTLVLPIMLANLIVGELVPKSYAALHPQRVSLTLYRFIKVFAAVFSVPAALITAVAGLFTARFGARPSFAIANQAEEEIKTIVESAQESGEIESDERELLHSVFEFTDTVAREVMTPRVDLDAVPIDSDPNEVVKLIRESGHSRIPMYEETDDQIVGIIHAKDLLLAMVSNGHVLDLRTLMRPALFVPENKNLHELLAEMRLSRSQLAIVQDEFGGTAGIVTIEDIVEELVGDIVDEYDVEEPEIVPTEGGFLVGGRAHVDDVNDAVGSEFDSEEFDTIGGYVFGLFGRQPKPNETLEADRFLFTVVETNGRRILRLRIEPLPKHPELAEVD
jgi:putative hemolysin